VLATGAILSRGETAQAAIVEDVWVVVYRCVLRKRKIPLKELLFSEGTYLPLLPPSFNFCYNGLIGLYAPYNLSFIRTPISPR
jgi:hypothetical protein